MKKVFLFILVLLGAGIAFSSCTKTDTYAERLKKERNAINNFIDSHDIEVIHKFPENGVFEKNQYFKEPNTGVYFHVESMGSGDTIKVGSTVFLRIASGSIFLVQKDTLHNEYNDGQATGNWIGFTYGLESTYTQGITSTDPFLTPIYLSPACTLPLRYKVCNGGVVSMIVPFSSGSVTQQAPQYWPLFIKRMRYIYNND